MNKDKTDNIENLIDEKIDKKILNAKLEMSESRVKFFMALGAGIVAVLGVIVPLLISILSSAGVDRRVDREIDNMRRDFERLANIQLRAPAIDAFVNGQQLENYTFTFVHGKYLESPIILKNVGDAPADNIRVRLYLNESGQETQFYIADNWRELDFVDETDYKNAFLYEYDDPRYLRPGNSLSFDFEVQTSALEDNEPERHGKAVLKVFYDQPEPSRIEFNIVVKRP